MAGFSLSFSFRAAFRISSASSATRRLYDTAKKSLDEQTRSLICDPLASRELPFSQNKSLNWWTLLSGSNAGMTRPCAATLRVGGVGDAYAELLYQMAD